MGSTIQLKAADGHTFSAYRAEPAGKPKGAIIVIMEIFGVNSHIRKVADEYAADGYLAIAPAMFDRVERGLEIGYTPPDIERGRGLMQKMKLEDALKDVEAEKANVAAAGKADIAAFDSAWVGVEVYVNVRSMDAYNEIEHNFEAKVTENLNSATPDVAKALADAKSLLGAYDAMLAMVEKATPLNAKFDDVARLRTVRAHLREVNPALKAGNLAKARKSFGEFDEKWDSIEDLVKERDTKAYNTIEDGMTSIGLALKAATPDAARVQTLVGGVMDEYNKIVAAVTREARGR